MLKSEFSNDDRSYHQGVMSRGLLFDDIFDQDFESLGNNTSFVATRRDAKIPAKSCGGRRVHPVGSQDVNLSLFHRNQSDCSYDDIISMCSSSPEGENPVNETIEHRGDNPLDLSLYEPQIPIITSRKVSLKSPLLEDMDVPMIELGEALFSTEDAAEVEEPCMTSQSCMTSQRSIYDQQKAFNPNIGSDVFFSSAAQLTPQDFIPEMSRPLTTPPPLIETDPLPSSELIPVPSISTFRSEMDFHGNHQVGGYQATSAFKLMPGTKRKVSGNSSIFTMSTHHYEPSPKTFKPSNQFEKKITNFIKRVGFVCLY